MPDLHVVGGLDVMDPGVACGWRVPEVVSDGDTIRVRMVCSCGAVGHWAIGGAASLASGSLLAAAEDYGPTCGAD